MEEVEGGHLLRPQINQSSACDLRRTYKMQKTQEILNFAGMVSAFTLRYSPLFSPHYVQSLPICLSPSSLTIDYLRAGHFIIPHYIHQLYDVQNACVQCTGLEDTQRVYLGQKVLRYGVDKLRFYQ